LRDANVLWSVDITSKEVLYRGDVLRSRPLFIIFTRQQWLRERFSVLCYTYISCQVYPNSSIVFGTCGWEIGAETASDIQNRTDSTFVTV